MTDLTTYQPHPFIGGRAAALRELAGWRAGGADAPKVVLVTGDPGSGRSRLLTGFLMLCEPSYREQFDLAALDPSTVPPAGPAAPMVFGATGLSAVQLLWAVADELGLAAERTEELYRSLAEPREEPVPVVVADVDRAGVLRATEEPARVAAEVLHPLALAPSIRLLAEVPRAQAQWLMGELPAGLAVLVDLDRAPWADEEALALQSEFATAGLGVDPVGLARRARSPLVVQLAARSLGAVPPDGPVALPGSVGDALDLHAERCGVNELTLRRLLAPLALTGPGGALPFGLWGRLASAVAGKDMAPALADGQLLLLPFIELVGEDEESAVRIVHPAVAEEVRERFGSAAREAQRRMAQALLATLPEGGADRWEAAAPYVREQLAGHALDGGVLPELLVDQGFLLHAEQVSLRAAVEHLVAAGNELPAQARTWLRLAPLFTRNEAGPHLRAALLEHALRQDGLPAAEFGPDLPWRTLWARPLPGVTAVTAALTPEGTTALVAVVPGTGEPTAEGATAGLAAFDALTGEPLPAAPDGLTRPSAEQRASTGLALSVGGDYLRVWRVDGDGAAGEQVAAFLSAEHLAGADLTPDGVLVLADSRGVSALHLTAAAAATER
ncbi:ATP-binding protein [Kitasatospora sp. NPDC056138]|uniref:ATP-binding protein n=1 Tax=Kitasatospora sp. NPDC056138 TaxID=3345724 RepID=UPI0035D9FF73